MATPSFAQVQHFFRLVDEKKITAENFQSFLENPNKVLENMDFPVTVDYSQSLGDMIAAGKYDWKNENVTSEHFPIDGKGAVELKLRLVHLGRNATTKQVEAHLDSLGLRPANIAELLAFGAKYPDKQREFPIVAFGSAWVSPGGARGVPCLDRGGSERSLNLNWGVPDFGWGDGCRFLAISK